MDSTNPLRELAETSRHAYNTLLDALDQLHREFEAQEDHLAAELVDEIATASLADTRYA